MPLKRYLIGLGCLFLFLGALLMGMMVLRPEAGDEDEAVSGAAVTQSTPAARDRRPSRLWPVAGGGSLAVGAALIGIGMNRWRRSAEGA